MVIRRWICSQNHPCLLHQLVSLKIIYSTYQTTNCTYPASSTTEPAVHPVSSSSFDSTLSRGRIGRHRHCCFRPLHDLNLSCLWYLSFWSGWDCWDPWRLRGQLRPETRWTLTLRGQLDAAAKASASKIVHSISFLIVSGRIWSQFRHRLAHDHPSTTSLLPPAASVPSLRIPSAHQADLHAWTPFIPS